MCLLVEETDAADGVSGKKIELVVRGSPAWADEAVRASREMIVKEDVQSLTSSLTSAQGPAASASMKERTAAQLRKDAELHNRLLAL